MRFRGESYKLKHSVKKLKPVGRQITGLSALEALDQLEFSSKKASIPYLQALKTAIAAARDQGIDEARLLVGILLFHHF